MKTQTGILDNYSTSRLLDLEQFELATKIESEASWLHYKANQILAKVENNVIERILLARLRKGIRSAATSDSAHALVSEMRGAYSTGQMETLPSFMPKRFFAAPNIDADKAALPGNNSAEIIYIPGGGFIFPPSRRQKIMMQKLSEKTGCEVIVGTHSLAPENPFPKPLYEIADLLESRMQKENPSRVFLGADTAGASIALGALQILQKRGARSLPAGVILFSPWCDLSLSGWSYITKSVTAESPFRMETAAFCARVYLQRHVSTDPLASPIFADPTGWPPILIHTSENDLHFDDAIQLAETGRQLGCNIRINYWDSPRHHLERLSSKDAEESYSRVRNFIAANMGTE